MNGTKELFFSLLNKHGRYKIGGKSFKFNNLVNGTATLSLETAHKYFTKLSGVASIQTGISSLSVNSGDIVCDLTLLQDASTTLEKFYATDLGKEIQKGWFPPYSATNTIYKADLSEATFKNNDGTQTQTVSILQNGQPLRIGGYNGVDDYYLNASGKVNRAIGNVDLGSLSYSYINNTFRATQPTNIKNVDKSEIPNWIAQNYKTVSYNDTWLNKNIAQSPAQNLIIVKDDDLTSSDKPQGQLSYELATPTTEQANSVMLRKGFTKCYDKNNLELELEIIDPLNFSNKIVQGKNAPTITAEKIITKGFTSGDEHFTQLYIYEDGEIWYVNSQGSAQAYASGVWELEYKQLQFDNKVSLTESERNALLNIYDLI